MSLQNEPILTTALAAEQARISVTASTNPIGLAAHLTKQAPPTEPRNLDAEIAAQVEALSAALETFETTNGQPNVELIAATTAVNELQVKLNEATHRLEQVKSLGTPLDRLRRATALAENRVTNLIGEYSRIVTAELLLERFGQEVNVLKADRLRDHRAGRTGGRRTMTVMADRLIRTRVNNHRRRMAGGNRVDF
jgi:hypothetical protein